MTTGSEPGSAGPSRVAGDIRAGQHANPYHPPKRRRFTLVRFLFTVQALGTLGWVWGAVAGVNIAPWEIFVLLVANWSWMLVWAIVKGEADLWREMYNELSDWHTLTMEQYGKHHEG